MSLESELRRAAAAPAAPLDFQAAVRRGQTLRRRRYGVLFVAVVAAVVVATPAISTVSRPPDVVFQPPEADGPPAAEGPGVADPEAMTGAELARALQHWRRFDAGPLSPVEGATTVWTGTALLVWGGHGTSTGGGSRQGALYRPDTGEWREIADAPLGGGGLQVGSWGEDRLFVWHEGSGAAYLPQTDTWELLPDAPVDIPAAFGSVWTGTEFVVFGSRERGDATRHGIAFSPATGRWRRLPPAPESINRGAVLWTGEEMVVFGSEHDDFNNRVIGKRERTRLVLYDPVANTWRTGATAPVHAQAPTAVWVGDRAIAWSYDLDDAAAYDPLHDEWRRLPDLPMDFGECYPQGVAVSPHALYAIHCGQAAVYDLVEQRWYRLDVPARVAGNLVWTGSQLLSWWSMDGLDRTQAWANP